MLRAKVRELYRERIVLERDYATKLQALGKKASDKKGKKISALVFGTEPTKSWDESTLQARFLLSFWLHPRPIDGVIVQ